MITKNLYDWRKGHNGLYISVNDVGQAYNILLFVQSFSTMIETGIIWVSDVPFNNAIRVEKDTHMVGKFGQTSKDLENSSFYDVPREFRTISEDGNSFNFSGIHLDFVDYTREVLYVDVEPLLLGEFKEKRGKISIKEFGI